MQRLLIVGGGYAGLWAALAAASQVAEHGGEVAIKLLSRDEFLVHRPRLYEKNPAALRVPLAASLDPVGVAFEAGAAHSFDTASGAVAVTRSDGGEASLCYDRLVLATGSELREPPVPGLAEHAWNIDTWEAALALDAHLAETLKQPQAPGHDCFVVVGAGSTGIELATEMRARIEAHSDPRTAGAARLVLLERAEMVGPELGANPRPVIEQALEEADVEVRLGADLARVAADGIEFADGERIESRTVIVTAGMRASRLAEALGVELDEIGRLGTDEMLRVQGVSGIYAAGDIARAYADDEHLALMSCQHSMVMGKYAGYNAARDLLGLPLRPYRQLRYVTCLDLGVSGAVFTTGWEREVQVLGAEAKQRKQTTMTERIALPTGSRAEIFAAAALD